MAIATIVTRGFGNGTFDGSIALVVTRGYGIGEAVTPAVVLPVTEEPTGLWVRVPFPRTIQVGVLGPPAIDVFFAEVTIRILQPARASFVARASIIRGHGVKTVPVLASSFTHGVKAQVDYLEVLVYEKEIAKLRRRVIELEDMVILKVFPE